MGASSERNTPLDSGLPSSLKNLVTHSSLQTVSGLVCCRLLFLFACASAPANV